MKIISSNRAKVVDEIMGLYKVKNEKVENELAIAQAEIKSLEDIIAGNMSPHGKGSLAPPTNQPQTQSMKVHFPGTSTFASSHVVEKEGEERRE